MHSNTDTTTVAAAVLLSFLCRFLFSQAAAVIELTSEYIYDFLSSPKY